MKKLPLLESSKPIKMKLQLKYMLRKRYAFTMVELIVATAVLALSLAIVIPFLSHSSKTVTPTISNKLFLQMKARIFADKLIFEVRKGSDIVRPSLGETTPFLVFADAENNVKFLYLTDNNKDTKEIGKPVYDMMLYTCGYGPSKNKIVKIEGNISKVSFSLLSPSSVLVDTIICDKKHSYEMLSHIGVMDLGE